MQAIIDKLYAQTPLSQQESYQLFEQIIRGEMEPLLMAALLTALKIKGETPEEISGAAQALLDNAVAFPGKITTLPILSEPVAMVQIQSIFQPQRLLSPQAVV